MARDGLWGRREFPAGMIFEAYKTDEIIRSLLIYFLMLLISIYVMEVILKKTMEILRFALSS